jgi:hypothetical protein
MCSVGCCYLVVSLRLPSVAASGACNPTDPLGCCALCCNTLETITNLSFRGADSSITCGYTTILTYHRRN